MMLAHEGITKGQWLVTDPDDLLLGQRACWRDET